MRRLLSGIACLVALLASCSAQIAYVKRDRLYVLPCGSSGLPKKGAEPVYICKLHPRNPRELSISWNSKGDIELRSSFDHQFFGSVKPVRGAKFHRNYAEVGNFPPEHSPDRSAAIIFKNHPEKKDNLAGPWFEDAYLVRAKDHSEVLLLKHSQGYARWSPKGDFVVLPSSDAYNNSLSKLVEYPSLKTLFVLSGDDPSFAPDGHSLALSAGGVLEYRPILFYDLRTGKPFPTPEVAGRWQTEVIADWSPDKHHYLEEDRAQQDGGDRWTEHCVGIGNLVSGKSIGLRGTTDAETPHYSKDGTHFLWIQRKTGRLEIIPSNHPDHRALIATGVSVFGIRR